MACCGIGSIVGKTIGNKCEKPIPKDIINKLKHITSQEDLFEIKTRDSSNFTYRGAFTSKAPSMVTRKEKEFVLRTSCALIHNGNTIIAEVEWKGTVKQCNISKCYFVEKCNQVMNNYTDLQSLSRSVPYARERATLWLLTFGADS
ncbi:hypothetical protein SNE40_010856 [Patella caerulea]|uniref:Uncharacterized protein n=1 Tax=Patella caerulea TaxID=87958 RepID=A0AAN8PS41_PATCE